jgi:hypothetical protein
MRKTILATVLVAIMTTTAVQADACSIYWDSAGENTDLAFVQPTKARESIYLQAALEDYIHVKYACKNRPKKFQDNVDEMIKILKDMLKK